MAKAYATRDALELRAQGKTYQQIGDKLGIPMRTVYGWIKQALADIPVEAADVARALAVQRLERNHDRLEALAGMDGTTAIGAMAEQRKTSESLRRMLGLDAPTQSRVRLELPDDPDEVERQLLERLRSEPAQEGEGDRNRAQDGRQDRPAAHPGQVDPRPLPGDPVGR